MNTSKLPEVLKGKAQMITAWAALIAALGSVSTGVLSFNGAKRGDVQSAKQDIIREVSGRVDVLEDRVSKQEAQIEYQADWICEENDGPPHRSFPCNSMTWEPPPVGRVSPVRRTNKPYPRN